MQHRQEDLLRIANSDDTVAVAVGGTTLRCGRLVGFQRNAKRLLRVAGRQKTAVVDITMMAADGGTVEQDTDLIENSIRYDQIQIAVAVEINCPEIPRAVGLWVVSRLRVKRLGSLNTGQKI